MNKASCALTHSCVSDVPLISHWLVDRFLLTISAVLLICTIHAARLQFVREKPAMRAIPKTVLVGEPPDVAHFTQ